MASNPRSRFHRIFSNPWLHVAAALLLIVTAGIEIIESLDELFQEESNIGAHHGMFIYGLVTLFHRVAEMMEGSLALEKGGE